ncbi:MAG TPA: hypothetical protein VK009_09135 [Chloroflexota bacterium]|nr:hypothetical protein [Chloroflexota bacterium]
MKEFHLEVYLSNGVRLETRFRQELDDNQWPSTRFYLGYSDEAALIQDLPWIVVGDIAYMPDQAVAVRITPVAEAGRELGSFARPSQAQM